MDIDALHSALFSLTVLPEQLRAARANIVTATRGDEPSDFAAFLDGLERDLRIAKATLARELGFAVCACCWPPEMFTTDSTGRIYCPGSGAGHPRRATPPRTVVSKIHSKPRRVDRFTRKQKETLLRVRDLLLDSVSGADSGRAANGRHAPKFVGDRADAGNDAADRDFALSLLTQGRDALMEVEQALKRIDEGTYGVCEISGERIPRARLEALPAARYTVECQAQVEKSRLMVRTGPAAHSDFAWEVDEESDNLHRRIERFPEAAMA